MNYFYSICNITRMQQVELENAIKLGQRIKELRTQKGKSLNSFVMEHGGTTTATWSRVESGKVNLKISTLIKVAAILGITVDKLLKDIDFNYSLEE